MNNLFLEDLVVNRSEAPATAGASFFSDNFSAITFKKRQVSYWHRAFAAHVPKSKPGFATATYPRDVM